MTDTELLQALLRGQARTNELLEQLVARAPEAPASPLLWGAGLDREVADIIIGGPDELIRRNRERRRAEAVARKKARGHNPKEAQ